jgi:hypothetical protein
MLSGGSSNPMLMYGMYKTIEDSIHPTKLTSLHHDTIVVRHEPLRREKHEG